MPSTAWRDDLGTRTTGRPPAMTWVPEAGRAVPEAWFPDRGGHVDRPVARCRTCASAGGPRRQSGPVASVDSGGPAIIAAASSVHGHSGLAHRPPSSFRSGGQSGPGGEGAALGAAPHPASAPPPLRATRSQGPLHQGSRNAEWTGKRGVLRRRTERRRLGAWTPSVANLRHPVIFRVAGLSALVSRSECARA